MHRLTMLTLLAASAALAQTAADFFDDKAMQEIRITIDPATWQRLLFNYRGNDYYQCDITWRGVTVRGVGIRVSGRTTRDPQKPSLRVDINRFTQSQRFLGLTSFVLLNNIKDFSMMKERLIMPLFNRVGVAAPRETSARLNVNEASLGVFTLVEATDKGFLTRVFNEDNGFLYEYDYDSRGAYRFEWLGPEPRLYSPSPFEQKIPDDPLKIDPKPLAEMIDIINNAPDVDFERRLAEYLDIRKFLTLMAVEVYMAEFDGILSDAGMNNFYLYRFANKKLSQFIPKDKDNSFTLSDYDGFKNANANRLMRRIMLNPGLRQIFLDKVLEAGAAAGGEGGWLFTEADRVYNLIQAEVKRDTLKRCQLGPCPLAESNAWFDQAAGYLKTFLSERPAIIRAQLARLGYTAPPSISQGSAVSAAGVLTGSVAPGSIVSLYGTNLAAEVRFAPAPFPVTLNGTRVLVGGTPVPLAYISPTQINFQLPWETPPGTATLRAEMNSIQSSVINLNVTPVAPGIFVIVNAAGGLVNSDSPAAAGDVLVIYANGLGPVLNRPGSGQLSPGGPPATVASQVQVNIGGLPAQVQFAGLSPGLIALYQVNVAVPAGVAPGDSTPVVISTGGAATPPTTIATR
ncbi:MAG: hypothetical protein FJW40_26580 [Acidobacteria bacterium]|nr:hypothetical protein [Acidobacteriota bacterium]